MNRSAALSSKPGSRTLAVLEDVFEAEDRQSRDLVRDLHRPKRYIYWLDLLLSAFVGWSAFIIAYLLPAWSPWMLLSLGVAVFALYRGLCFIHEISHLNLQALPRFQTVWNWLIGYPLLIPSFVYCGVHQSHHRLASYGTNQDPEYMPFARSSRMTVFFALQSFVVPALLLVRFLLLTPAGLIIPRFQRWLVVYASSLTMNLAYRRESTPALIRTVMAQSAMIWCGWALIVIITAAGYCSWRIFAEWFVVSALISFVNTLRTLGAHAYESAGEPLDRQGQLADSIDTPGAVWTALWAPVGLRYHALHHYFPGIPYHNLREAHHRLVTALPIGSSYHRSKSSSLLQSLVKLCRSGLGRDSVRSRR